MLLFENIINNVNSFCILFEKKLKCKLCYFYLNLYTLPNRSDLHFLHNMYLFKKLKCTIIQTGDYTPI